MARIGVDYETIKKTAIKLLSQGIAPSVQKIREELGTGSNTTIAEHLKVWRDEYAKKHIHYLPANMPKELISAFEVLWQTAMEQAQNQLVEYKLVIEVEKESALQKERDAAKSVQDIKIQINELSLTLEQELAIKQKINIDLAIANERLAKQEAALSKTIKQHEDRLQHVYKEKDQLITECNHLKNEINKLQEKLTFQAEQQQHMLAEQNTLHEQSENRWLNLIDQAKQETKDVYKKYQHISHSSNEKIKKLNSTLSDYQKNVFEKDVQLKMHQERIIQLQQEIKFIETDYIKSRAVIIKFEEERKFKKSKKESPLKDEVIV